MRTVGTRHCVDWCTAHRCQSFGPANCPFDA